MNASCLSTDLPPMTPQHARQALRLTKRAFQADGWTYSKGDYSQAPWAKHEDGRRFRSKDIGPEIDESTPWVMEQAGFKK